MINLIMMRLDIIRGNKRAQYHSIAISRRNAHGIKYLTFLEEYFLETEMS